jgi:hypothetical protein
MPDGPRIDLVIDIASLCTSAPLTALTPTLLFKDKYPVGVWAVPMLLERLLQPATPGNNATITIVTSFFIFRSLVRMMQEADRLMRPVSGSIQSQTFQNLFYLKRVLRLGARRSMRNQ